MQDRQYTSYRWTIQGVLIFMQISLGLNFMAPTPLFTLIMDDYGINRGVVSLLVSAPIIVLTISLLPSGILIAKIGSKRAMVIGGLLMSSGLIAPLLDSFTMMVLMRLLFGVGAAICLPVTSSILMEWFKPNELPVMNGINESGRSVGVAFGILAAVSIANVFGWDMVFFFFGVLPMVATVIWFVGGRSADVVQEQSDEFSLSNNIDLIFNRNTLLIAIASMGPFALFIGYSSWLPSYYNEIHGMTIERSSSLVAVLPFVAAIATPLSGIIVSKSGIRRPILIMAGLTFPLLAFGCFMMTSTILITICIIGLGSMFALYIVTILTIPMELPGVDASKVGIVTAAALTIGNGTAVMSPIFIGSLTDITGSYIPALSVVAIMPLLMIVSGLFLPETGKRVKVTN
jgi:cyanate permease